MGHLWRQARHMAHLLSTMTGRLFSIFMILDGQMALHSPHPSHMSVTQNIFVF